MRFWMIAVAVLAVCVAVGAAGSANQTEDRSPSAGQVVRVAAISFVPTKFDLRGNADRLEQAFREAKKGQAQIAVAPEGALDGYVVNEIIRGEAPAERMWEAALAIDDSVIRRFQRLARELEMCLVFGFAEKVGDDVFNCAIFIDQQGRICGKQHKMQLAEGSHPSWWFNRLGTRIRAFDTPFGRCGLLICNDRWNPQLASLAALDGAQYLLIPSFGSRAKSQDDAVLNRGKENGLPVVEANVSVTLIVDDGRIAAVDRHEEGITFGTITIAAPQNPQPQERDRLEQEFIKWRETEMRIRYEKTIARREQPSQESQRPQEAGVSAEPLVVDLWPGPPPQDVGIKGQETSRIHPSPLVGPTKLITNVTRPTLTIYRPSRDQNTGTAMIVCPGGGYWDLYWELEGAEVAAWLTSQGMTGIILKYRVPRRPGEAKGEPPPGPLLDAQRAVSLVRSRSAEWGFDPQRVGMVGFSAGGHLALATATSFEKRKYEPIDAVDTVSCRPDFAVLCYSGYLKAKDKDELWPGLQIPAGTPPIFLSHASDDRESYGGSNAENSAIMYLALKRAGIPAELHIYATGDHDFGVRQNEKLPSSWPHLCVKWLNSQGLLKPIPGK